MVDSTLDSFSPNGVLTLTTDFGTSGPYVGVLHGVILRQSTSLRTIDLTHEVEVHWPAEAGFWLERAYGRFPAGTVHVAVVESGGGSSRLGLVVLVDGQAFVGPDNGLLANLADREGAVVREIASATLGRMGIGRFSPTFRGRDVQAPVGGALAAGQLEPSAVGPTVDDWAPSLLEAPEVLPTEVRGVVVTVDSFGNVVTNIPAELLAQFPAAEVTVGSRVVPLKRSYGEVNPGELMALINAFGVLEIARAQRSAADMLGLGRGAPVIVRRRPQRD